MLCTEALGNLGDESFAGELRSRLGGDPTPDFVDFDWHEAFKKLHRKRSSAGVDLGVRLGDWVLAKGLRSGDVLGVDEATRTAYVVRLLPTKALVIDVDRDHPFMLAKVGWEVGNTHAALFYGDDVFQLVTTYTEPVERLLTGLHGVSVRVDDVVLDPSRRVSTNAHHHHDHDHHHGSEGHHHDHTHEA